MSETTHNFSVIAIIVLVSLMAAVTLFYDFTPTGAVVGVPATNTKSGVVVNIPAHAVEKAPGVFDLGFATDVDGTQVQGYMFIFRKESAKPAHVGRKKKGGTKCYSFLANSAKWKQIEQWIVNTANNEGLSSTFVFDTLKASLQKWESASSMDIIGTGSTTTATLSADNVQPDGQNEVYFGSIASPGSIAVTIVWGRFSGPPRSRELVEWDQVYDEVDFDWSSSGEIGKMDFENIATHELGHTDGMGHPDNTCTQETMYAYANNGETKKQSLNSGDIEGINKLY